MKKKELTQEERDFKLDDFTLNNQFIYYINKSKCFNWTLRIANEKYNALRFKNDHATAMLILTKEMFNLGKNN